MFGELTREATSLAERTNVLQARIDRLAIKVTQLDSTVEEGKERKQLSFVGCHYYTLKIWTKSSVWERSLTSSGLFAGLFILSKYHSTLGYCVRVTDKLKVTFEIWTAYFMIYIDSTFCILLLGLLHLPCRRRAGAFSSSFFYNSVTKETIIKSTLLSNSSVSPRYPNEKSIPVVSNVRATTFLSENDAICDACYIRALWPPSASWTTQWV